MKFTIPFDKEIYHKQIQLQFDYVWKKAYAKSWKGLVIGLLFVLIGIFFISQESIFGLVLTIIGSISLYKYYEFINHYRTSKQFFFSAAEEYVQNKTKGIHNSIWQFEENFFRYKDDKCDLKLDWSFFKNFDIIEENIFLNTSQENISYVLGKIELEESDYEDLLSFLNSKLQKV